jgi:hypothetical protein
MPYPKQDKKFSFPRPVVVPAEKSKKPAPVVKEIPVDDIELEEEKQEHPEPKKKDKKPGKWLGLGDK